MADVAALLSQALAHEREGRSEAARSLYQAVLDDDPVHPGALLKLGVIAHASARFDEAGSRLISALAHAPARGMNPAPICVALAELARARGDPVDAVRHLQAAVVHDPGDVKLRFALAQAARTAGDMNGAVAALAGATEVAPDHVEVWLGLAGLLMEIELASPAARKFQLTPLAHAINAFEHALALAPDAPAVLAQAAMAFRYACDWERASACEARLVRAGNDASEAFVVSPIMAAALLRDPVLQARGIREFAQRTLPTPVARAPGRLTSRGTRLRVGYLSADFHEHATAHLAAGLFEHHARERVITFAYALDRDDGGAMRRRLHAAFDHWRDVRLATDAAAAATIASDGLDVLVDLKGHTQGGRLGILAHRPAPVQIHYLGFPGTLGYAAIDAQVGDAVVVPPGSERHYAERILRMPASYQANDCNRPLPDAVTRAAAGLPESGLVLACFNQAYKLSHAFVACWLDVLAQHVDAVLWLTVPHALARENLRNAARSRGIAVERIIFAPHLSQSDHLARLRCADLALDVLPYGSHTTGSDALWCGVPLLTVLGETFAGRVGASLAHAADLPAFVTGSIEAYAARLAGLAGHRDELFDSKARLERERRRLALFDTPRFTRDFENLLEVAANLRRAC